MFLISTILSGIQLIKRKKQIKQPKST